MKLLITADLHLTSYKRQLIDPLQQIKLALLEMLQYVKDVDAIVIAGDIFHDKVYVYKNALDIIEEFFTSVPSDKFIYVIAGNHDKGRYGCLLEVLPQMSNIEFIIEPKTVENMLMVPYDKNQLQLIYDSYDNQQILISHFGVNEAKLQSGISFVDPIKLRDLKMFKQVILGHYHLAQELDNLIYVGNIAPLDWNDKNQQKRIVKYNTETFEWESIPIKSVRNFYEFKDPTPEEIEQAKKLLEEGHIVRIFTDKYTRDDIDGATIIHTVEYKSKFEGMSDLYDIACKFIEEHPEKEQLISVLDQIRQHIPKTTELEDNT